MKTRKILFRADGNARVGLGHVVRSLALAQMLHDDYECIFIINNPLVTLRNKILAVCKIKELALEEDHDEASYLIDEVLSKQDILVLDGYKFDTDYQKIVRPHVHKLVCIDDIHSYRFLADVVINHAPGLDPDQYETAHYSKLLLGTQHALLRQPFLEAASQSRMVSEIKDVFICFGGADPNSLSTRIVTILMQDPLIETIHLVIGAASKIEFPSPRWKDKVKLYKDLDAALMCQVMRQCDLGIAPASTICYELATVKMPIISGFYVDNQINIYEGFLASGAIMGVGDFNTVKDEAILKMIADLRRMKDYSSYMSIQSKLFDADIKDRYLHTFEALC